VGVTVEGVVRRLAVVLGIFLLGCGEKGSQGLEATPMTQDIPAPDGRQYERVAVIWESIEVSDDRRLVTVTAAYPLGDGFCVKGADGVHVEAKGDVAYVAAWLRGPDLPVPEFTGCTLECALVTQSVSLAEPLPDEVTRLEPVEGAVESCW
jgi:hypothetical protein